MNDIEKENIGEKVCGDEGKRNRHEFKSQAGSKKMKTEEEDPEKNTSIDVLPEEVLQLILKNLETKDVVTAGQTCRRWFFVGDSICQQRAKEIEASWKMSDYVPTPAEVSCASLLAAHGHLPNQVITTKAKEIKANWRLINRSFDSYIPSPAEVHCASSFAANGLLPHQVITNKADMIAGRLYHPSLTQLQCGAALASQGYITQLKSLELYDLDISSVSAEDLRSLVKCSDLVSIGSVTCDLLSFVLSNVQCTRINIANTSLTTADTQQLVAAMVTRVKEVSLGGAGRSWWSGKLDEGVTLDMDTLAQYNGLGKCEEVLFWSVTTERYRDQLKVWAGNMGWQIEEMGGIILIKRK